MRRSCSRTPAPAAALVAALVALALTGCGAGADQGATAPAGATTSASATTSTTASSSAPASSSASTSAAPAEPSSDDAPDPAGEEGPVQITAPADGAGVPAGALTISGTSTSAEGNLLWEVADASGAVVAQGFTTGGANGEVGPFSTTADGLVAGTTYTVSVWAPDESDGESGQDARAQGDTATVTAG